MNQKYNTNYTPEDLQRIGASGLIDQAKNKAGSETGLKALGFIYRKRDELKKLVEKAKKQHRKLTDFKEYRILLTEAGALVGNIVDSMVRDFIKEMDGKND